MIYIIETIDAKEGETEKLKHLLLDVVPLSRAEMGCLFYDLYQEREKPYRFALVMAFKDQQAYQDHITAPYIAALEKYGETVYHNVIETFYQKLK
jgi:quinol monooxygenase YgiN